MKRLLGTAAVIACTPVMLAALGLDRSGQPISLLFEEGNYVELNFGRVFPEASGEDLPIALPDGTVLVPGGSESGNAAEDFNQFGAGIKYQFNDRLSVALIADEPYGSDVAYPSDGSLTLGGTRAVVDSAAVTALGRYAFSDAFSIHAGLRYQKIEADVTLAGAGYGALSGYNAAFGSDGDLGHVIGAAFERPEIALRVALTYFSGTEHDLRTTETVGGIGVDVISDGLLPATSTTRVETPEAINLDFQTGIAEDTLLFGSVRYAWYEDTIVAPTFFDANVDPAIPVSSLTEIGDGAVYNLGIGRRLTDRLSGSVALGYEPEDGDDLVSPLAPTNGSRSLALGLSYDATDALTLSGGARYVRLGDAQPETGTPDVARAEFSGSDVFGIGMRIGYRF